MYRTRSDLPEQVRERLVGLLNGHLADAIDLQLQCKMAHWNLKGPEFASMHAMLDEIAEAVESHIDRLAERATQLGGVADGWIRGVAKRTTLPAYPEQAVSCAEHVEALATSVAAFGRAIRGCVRLAAELGDPGTADLCTEISLSSDRWLWLLESHVQTARMVSIR